jgi:hypothetical protein
MIGILRQAAATVLAVMVLSAFPLAQETSPAPARPRPAATAPAPASATAQPAVREQAGGPANAERTRDQLRDVLQRHPPSLAEVLRLDPSLLASPEYLAPYPELASFLDQHPEVAHNPAFYVGTPHDQSWERNPNAAVMRMWEEVLQGIMIVFVILTFVGVTGWLVRTLIDYRRWHRLTKVQTETHTKLLDRLTSQEDLIAYMQTPAGRRFLESAPITLDAASRPLGAPLSRVLWSAQAGVVLALGGVGLLFVSRGAIPEVGQGIWSIGILALALGAGFLLSAVVAYLLSSRLGLFDQRPATATDTLSGAGLPAGRD